MTLAIMKMCSAMFLANQETKRPFGETKTSRGDEFV
jgi:hypothetical protein